MMRKKAIFARERARLRDLQTAILAIEACIHDSRYEGFKEVLKRNLDFTHQQYADLNAEMRRNGWNG
jgi:hypothetical protein